MGHGVKVEVRSWGGGMELGWRYGVRCRELDGLRSRVVMGAGAGRQVTTLEKPAPVAQV